MTIQEIEAQRSELDRLRLEIEISEQRKTEEQKVSDKVKIVELNNTAKVLRKKAIEAATNGELANQKLFASSANDAETEANELMRKYDILPEQKATKNWNFWHKLSIFVVVCGAFGVAFFCKYQFNEIGEQIIRHNSDIQTLMQKNSDPRLQESLISKPYDLSSYQKVYFDKLTHIIDLSEVFFILLLLCPYVLVYILPFFKTSKNIWEEFLEELTPFQRHLFVYLYSALALLVLAIYRTSS